jgi:hypothetical protein
VKSSFLFACVVLQNSRIGGLLGGDEEINIEIFNKGMQECRTALISVCLLV